MAAERLSMRKIKEVLRLKFELGLANRQIARSCSVNHSTVADYLSRAKATGLDCWPLPANLDESGLEARLFPSRPATPAPTRTAPDWATIHDELRARSMSRCNCFGRNINSQMPKAINTAGSVNSMRGGPKSSMWFCGKSIVPVKNYLLIMRAIRSRSSTPKRAQ